MSGKGKKRSLKGLAVARVYERIWKWVARAAQNSILQGERIEQDEMRHDPKICSAL
jgi:hypothetical protein